MCWSREFTILLFGYICRFTITYLSHVTPFLELTQAPPRFNGTQFNGFFVYHLRFDEAKLSLPVNNSTVDCKLLMPHNLVESEDIKKPKLV